MYETINEYPRPVIAKINGYCLGGGLELALACDLRIATTRSEFGSPEILLGTIPGVGATRRLMRLLGETRAKELVFRGTNISAETALEWGLINRAVPCDEFPNTVEEFVTDIVEGPPIAYELGKRVMNLSEDASLEAALTMERQAYSLLSHTNDLNEGVEAFLENREPEFTGE